MAWPFWPSVDWFGNPIIRRGIHYGLTAWQRPTSGTSVRSKDFDMLAHADPGWLVPFFVSTGMMGFPLMSSAVQAHECLTSLEAIKPPVSVKFDCFWEVYTSLRPLLAWAVLRSHDVMVRVTNDCYSAAVSENSSFKDYVKQQGVLSVLSRKGVSHFRAIALDDVQAAVRAYCYKGVQPFTESQKVRLEFISLREASFSQDELNTLRTRHGVAVDRLSSSLPALSMEEVIQLRRAMSVRDF